MAQVYQEMAQIHLDTIYKEIEKIKIKDQERFFYYRLPDDMSNPERDDLVYILNKEYECSHYSTGVLWISWIKNKPNKK